jgi:hypothetical protein
MDNDSANHQRGGGYPYRSTMNQGAGQSGMISGMVSRHRAMVSTSVIMVIPTRAMEEVTMETATTGDEGPDDMVEDAPLMVASKAEEEGSTSVAGTTPGVAMMLKVVPIARCTHLLSTKPATQEEEKVTRLPFPSTCHRKRLCCCSRLS